MNWKISMCSTKYKVPPAYSPTVAHECKHINAPSDVCRESEWFVFVRWTERFLYMCSTKHKVSPTYSPTVAHECKHINAPSDVCRESEWFVFGRWTERFLCVEQNTRFPLHIARRWLMSASVSMHRRTYAGNPNDLYSVDEIGAEHVREVGYI